ncbi:NPC intracellular cholesterol transporter 2 homolog a [Neocloeon triangulifer]|uniref:NPC intracellular cholesterol transporter 2 homolog a n=1 Tax=Neocloeon triangulifer TaxID=2078957 RepID=UPI00286F4F70|nr:NPC intracellular cholesterol transporter 2 homolog a [Neocloeon triangulifer]
MAHRKLVLVAATFGLVLQSAAASVMFENCGTSTVGKVSNIDISGCDTHSTCKLIRGSNASLAISFQTSGGAKQLQSVVHGVIHGLPVPFNFPYPDACSYGGLSCPIETNTPLVYTAALPILKTYPRISVKIQWELKDEDDNDIFCVRIPSVLH